MEIAYENSENFVDKTFITYYPAALNQNLHTPSLVKRCPSRVEMAHGLVVPSEKFEKCDDDVKLFINLFTESEQHEHWHTLIIF
ncbi:hypothetical protein RclHR1_26790001 [Rhizophagus clarus]|uniref:Uncharacterized protein n=1 Tax=Rhizophagus clarus TaxID=94130 RepID=A0A2Z6RVK5_9GLOM|nr:hypothetical protein RclHR1_26790001 [Rhizophagus clarus]